MLYLQFHLLSELVHKEYTTIDLLVLVQNVECTLQMLVDIEVDKEK